MTLANCPCCSHLERVDSLGRMAAHRADPQLGAGDATDRRPCRGSGRKPEPHPLALLLTGSLSIALAVLAQIGVYR